MGRVRVADIPVAKTLEQARVDGGAQTAQGRGLLFATAFGQRFGEVGEQHREPQPYGDGQDEARRGFCLAAQGHDPQHGGQDAAHVHDEHDGVLQLRGGRELAQAVQQGGRDQRAGPHAEGALFRGDRGGVGGGAASA
ncbi:hypothetical protein D3C87_1419040 [compost metagenome]